MTTTTQLRVPDLVNPRATITLLESTGLSVDAATPRLLDEFAQLIEEHGPDAAADRFLAARHPDTTQRWAVFVATHLFDGDAPETLHRPTWTIPPGVRGRPVSVLEQALCRVTVDRWDTRDSAVAPAQYALAEHSATSGELVRLPIDAVTVAAQATVKLSGGRDQLPRTVTLDQWATKVVIDRLQALSSNDRSTPFVYNGAEPGTNKAQASASGNLSRVLRVAGLGDDPTLNPTSIRNTCAARLHQADHRIEYIAAAMGAKSLDRMSRILQSAPQN